MKKKVFSAFLSLQSIQISSKGTKLKIMSEEKFQIITFYEFKRLENLPEIKTALKAAMDKLTVRGTIIIAEEGFNATVSGVIADIENFIEILEKLFETKLNYKSSFHAERPFLKSKVRIKQEIVSLRKKVDIEKGTGTQVKSA